MEMRHVIDLLLVILFIRSEGGHKGKNAIVYKYQLIVYTFGMKVK